MSWPALTGSLKSTYSLAMLPETWLPTSTVATALKGPVALTVWLMSPPANVPCAFAYAGIAEAPDGRADVLDIKGQEGRNLRLFLDSKSRRLLMATYEMESVDPEQVKALTQSMMSRAKADPENAAKLGQALSEEVNRLAKKTITVRMHFSDYRAFGGITIPTNMLVDAGPVQEQWTISSFKLNPPLKPELFKKK